MLLEKCFIYHKIYTKKCYSLRKNLEQQRRKKNKIEEKEERFLKKLIKTINYNKINYII